VITINCPLHPETEHLFNDALIGTMKRGSYLVNTARGKICDRDAIVRALASGQLAGYAGAAGSPLADDAATWHDAAYLRDESLGPSALRRRGARNP
jgi:phosphoglycerate dehydrogenase-like enzyme